MVQVDSSKIEKYLKNCYLDSQSPKTIRNKKETLSRLLKFVSHNSLSFDVNAINEYKMNLMKGGWQNSSVACEMRYIKTFCKYLFEQEDILEDFSNKLTSPKINRKSFPILPIQTIERVIYEGTRTGVGDNSINKERKETTRDALLTILATGLRNFEVRGIRNKDVVLDAETPYFLIKSKGGNVDEVVIPASIISIIERRMHCELLFPVTEKHLNVCLKRGINILKIKLTSVFTCHNLRRNYATNLAINGANHFLIMKLLRHSDITVTERYIQTDLNILSRTAHTYSDFNRKALSVQDTLKFYEKLLLNAGIDEDKRFKCEIYKDNKELVVKILLKND